MSKYRLDPGQIEVVHDDVARALRAKAPAERLAMIFAANRRMRTTIAAALRTWHPDWSDQQVAREVARRMSRGAG